MKKLYLLVSIFLCFTECKPLYFKAKPLAFSEQCGFVEGVEDEDRILKKLDEEKMQNLRNIIHSNKDLSSLKEDSPLLNYIIYKQPSTDLLKECLQRKADPNGTDNMRPLLLATSLDNLEAVRILIDAGANPNAIQYDNYFPLKTALMRACEELKKNSLEIVKLLLRYDASVHLTSLKNDNLNAVQSTFQYFCQFDLEQEKRNRIIKILLAHDTQYEINKPINPKILTVMKTKFHKFKKEMNQKEIISYKKTARLIKDYLTIMYFLAKKLPRDLVFSIMQFDALSKI